ncbi:hypothetical protein BD626DRAFT_116106 [Schizophyllum amplum]|uniref:Secreted protein n=1 Tax=Schizophyllum amplum TaxID=97359 RepID=A0A550CUH2_9AGAR|nr:hypothetical protein BD626DRAFT_116106 [Auriculariopsis ampla]
MLSCVAHLLCIYIMLSTRAWRCGSTYIVCKSGCEVYLAGTNVLNEHGKMKGDLDKLNLPHMESFQPLLHVLAPCVRRSSHRPL